MKIIKKQHKKTYIKDIHKRHTYNAYMHKLVALEHLRP